MAVRFQELILKEMFARRVMEGLEAKSLLPVGSEKKNIFSVGLSVGKL
jgi:hypothetical protein